MTSINKPAITAFFKKLPRLFKKKISAVAPHFLTRALSIFYLTMTYKSINERKLCRLNGARLAFLEESGQKRPAGRGSMKLLPEETQAEGEGGDLRDHQSLTL
jgi:hypothetical protein